MIAELAVFGSHLRAADLEVRPQPLHGPLPRPVV